MRIKQTIIFLLALLLSFAVLAEIEDEPTSVRKKVDEKGKVVFSKSGFADKKPSKKPKQEEVKAPVKPRGPQVDLYYASWDPYSNKAIEFFRANRIVVNAYDIDQDPEAAARKKRIDPNFVGLPLVIINGVVIRGVDEKKYQDALSIPVPAPQ